MIREQIREMLEKEGIRSFLRELAAYYENITMFAEATNTDQTQTNLILRKRALAKLLNYCADFATSFV